VKSKSSQPFSGCDPFDLPFEDFVGGGGELGADEAAAFVDGGGATNSSSHRLGEGFCEGCEAAMGAGVFSAVDGFFSRGAG
jgi:hypothetical protein